MKNEEISNRIKRLCKQKNVPVKTLLEECGINRNFMYDITRKETTPAVDKLTKIANYLGVTIDYLMGGEPDATPSLDEQLSGVDFALYSETKDMTEAQKQDVLRFVQFVKQQGKETK